MEFKDKILTQTDQNNNHTINDITLVNRLQ